MEYQNWVEHQNDEAEMLKNNPIYGASNEDLIKLVKSVERNKEPPTQHSVFHVILKRDDSVFIPVLFAQIEDPSPMNLALRQKIVSTLWTLTHLTFKECPGISPLIAEVKKETDTDRTKTQEFAKRLTEKGIVLH